VPLDERHALADFARRVKADVVLVVGLRLGCLNHALLTAQAVAHAELKLAGWVANAIDPHFERASDNVRALEERLKAPLLGVIPHRNSPNAAAALEFLDLDPLD
jgi:dethiobiotin synthetase